MKEELQSKLVEILSSIQSSVGQAKDFAMNQLPDIAQQYVLYGRIESIVSFIFLIALFAISAAIVFGAIKSRSGDLDSFFSFVGGGWWVAAVACFVSLIAASNVISGALLVWFAPKVWLLKHLASLMK